MQCNGDRGAHTFGSAQAIDRAAHLATSASESFNNGLRSYYFALAALAWFINGWFLMAVTTWVVLVLYLREFQSDTLRTLVR